MLTNLTGQKMTAKNAPRFSRVNYQGTDGRWGTILDAPVISLHESLSEAPTRAKGLTPCTDWDAADWRYSTGIQEVALNVTFTGRTIQNRADAGWVRCRIEWPQDGEYPAHYSKGWVRVW